MAEQFIQIMQERIEYMALMADNTVAESLPTFLESVKDCYTNIYLYVCICIFIASPRQALFSLKHCNPLVHKLNDALYIG